MIDYTISPLEGTEYLYANKNSYQISGQTGAIGILIMGFNGDGRGYSLSWEDVRKEYNSPEFKEEFGRIISSLKTDGFLLHQIKLYEFCKSNEAYAYSYGDGEFAVRLDTEKYSYIMILNPEPERGIDYYNLICFCYIRKFLDFHLEHSKKGIEFRDRNYNPKFRIADGEKIRIIYYSPEIEGSEHICRYVDECHFILGDYRVYHKDEFVDAMVRGKFRIIPLRSSLPETCYVYVPLDDSIGIITKGESECSTNYVPNENSEESKVELTRKLNEALGVTKAQAAAMEAALKYGWDAPEANPVNYDKNGVLKQNNLKI